MNKFQIVESEGNRLLKLSNEPATKESGSSWDTHLITWLPPTRIPGDVYSDTIIHSRLEDGKVIKTSNMVGFRTLGQLLCYLKNKYSPESPIYQEAKRSL